jgi:acetyl esterase/lipase
LWILATAASLALGGCSLVTRAGVALFYEKADLPAAQVVRDLCYTSPLPCDTPKHTLDLYRPTAPGWPVVIFVHGGNWDSGDKNYRAGGADVYANIGRFYATRGIGVAVINYRLQPGVAWSAQVDDVRAAVAWVRVNIERRGGQPDRIFLMGHSAGAHLAAMAALASGDADVRGVIAVSGAALDLTDERTYQLGGDRDFYRQRFQGRAQSPDWQRPASPAMIASASAPPFLILCASGETKALQRQSQLLHDALTTAGASSQLLIIAGESHTRMVLALSHPGKRPAAAIVEFVQGATP